MREMTVFQPETLDQAIMLCERVCNTQMVPKAYQGKPDDALVAIIHGAEIGLPFMQSLQNIACINGKPSIYGDALIALVRGGGRCDYIKESFDEKLMMATCKVRRTGEEEEEIRTFSQMDAQQAGLWQKTPTWKSYPKRMLQMRARSWALRDVFADFLGGISIAEEVLDIPDRTLKEINPRPKKTTEQLEEEILEAETKPAPKKKTAAKKKTTKKASDKKAKSNLSEANFDDLMNKISLCESEKQLNDLVTDLADLPEDLIGRARGSWKAKMQALKAGQGNLV